MLCTTYQNTIYIVHPASAIQVPCTYIQYTTLNKMLSIIYVYYVATQKCVYNICIYMYSMYISVVTHKFQVVCDIISIGYVHIEYYFMLNTDHA